MKWRTIPGWLIILLGSLAGLVITLVVSGDAFLTERQAPSSLPALPAAAEAIYGLESPDFFGAELYIQAMDGKVYHWAWEQGGRVWQIIPDLTAVETGRPCSTRTIRVINEVASPVVDCQVVQTFGEWCPGPLVSYAITENGEVWQLEQEQGCPFIFVLALMIFVPAGFILGSAIVFVRWVVRKIKSRRNVQSAG